MKRFTKAFAVLVLLASFNSIKAQSIRPKLFDGYNNTINFPASELDKLFTIVQGTSLQVSLPGFTLQGTLAASVQRYDNLKSVMIRSTNFNGAVFSISKRINADNSISYIGRLINDQYADGYELKSGANGYYLNKIKLDDLVQDRQ